MEERRKGPRSPHGHLKRLKDETLYNWQQGTTGECLRAARLLRQYQTHYQIALIKPERVNEIIKCCEAIIDGDYEYAKQFFRQSDRDY